MSYPPPSAPQPTDSSRRFLNMSAGALLAIASGLLLVCCVGPIAFCFLSGTVGMFGVVSKPEPQVELTSCDIGENTAKVGLRVTNPSDSTESFTVVVQVRDASGARVGEGSAYVSSVRGGQSASDTATVVLEVAGGVTCHVTGAR